MADILGRKGKIPENAAEDSFSFFKVLTDNATDKPTRPFTIHHSINGSFAIRKGPWKLALCPGSGGWSAPRPAAAFKNKELPLLQLYNLTDDPAEQDNLFEKKPELVNELIDQLKVAIRNGRTNPGPKQSNEGYPNTFHERLLSAFPTLKK